ncbi:MAG TPA: Zn-ribbon domain-containing OB-fold protein [Burkholderiaceae bacterium]|nr:Zn-ribbon domain-containing OB-fold protein [Burkholderiaceae bacterium]
MGNPRPLPEADNGAAAFWEGARRGELLVQRCDDCGNHQHYARPFCVACRGRRLTMVPVGGRGVLHSFTVVHRAPFDDLPAPYVVALVRLQEGPTILSHLVGCDPAAARCDMPVRVDFQPLRDGVMLPVFRSADGA